MNPLRFRSLRRERKTNTPIRYCAVLTAMVALGVLAGPQARAIEDIQQVLVDQQACKHLTTDDASVIYSDELGTVLKTTYDPKANCDKNSGDENDSFNAAAVDRTADLKRLRNDFASERHGREFLRSQGACRLAYQGIQDVYDTFYHLRETYCNETNSRLQTAKDCGAPSDKNCEPDWKAVLATQKQYVKDINAQNIDAIKYLNALRHAASTARDAYQADLGKLERYFTKRTKSATAPTLTDSLPDDPSVKAANGNRDTQQSNSLQDYYALLHGIDLAPASGVRQTSSITHSSGKLIAEEDVAMNALKNYGDAFQKQLVGYREKAEGLADWSSSLISKNGLNGPAGDSPVKKLTNYAPDITTSAGAAQKLLGNDTTGAAISGAASHAPIAAMAAAAGLGALAVKSFGSADKSAAGSSSEAPALPNGTGKNEMPATTNLTDPTADQRSAATGKPGPVLGGTTVPVAKADPANAGPVSGNVSNSFSSGEGSSRMLAGRRSAATGAPASTTAETGGGIPVADLGSSFTQNLEPKPSPKAPAQSPGSEVANLLGQMKNLFNFDEPPPGGGGAPGGGAPMPGGGAPDVGAGGSPALGGGDMPGGGPDAPAQAMADAGESPAGGASAPDQAHGSPFGRIDTSLFQRVRARHHRCMERGLVLYGLKERVE